LHNIIEEVNQAQTAFAGMIEECKRSGISTSLVGSTLLDSIKPVLREAWKATLQMDSFDMEDEFKTKRYNPNRQSLKSMCDDLCISTYDTSPRPSTRTSAHFENAPKFDMSSRPSTRTVANFENSSKSNASSSQPSSTNNPNSSKKEWYENGCFAALVTWIVIGIIAGGICVGCDGDFATGFFISGFIVLIFSRIFTD